MNTTMPNDAASNRSAPLTTGGIWKGGAIGAAVGAVVNVVLYFAASAGGVSMIAEFEKGSPPIAMPFPPVVIASFVPFVFASLVAMALSRFTAKASSIFVGIAVVMSLLSMSGPAMLPGASVGLRVVLGLMHVVSGITITGGILRFGKR